MTPIEKSYQFPDGKIATFHVICDNFILNFNKKICQGTVNSFFSGKVDECFSNGKVEAVSVKPFQFDYADISDIEKEIQVYVNTNIDNIILNEL